MDLELYGTSCALLLAQWGRGLATRQVPKKGRWGYGGGGLTFSDSFVFRLIGYQSLCFIKLTCLDIPLTLH